MRSMHAAMLRVLNRRALSASFSTSCRYSSKVGFIGLGIMGGPMAENLMKKGHEVIVHDINTEAVDQLVSHGAGAASSPKHVAEQCDQLLTMLRNSEQVLQCYTDPDTGVLASVQTGSLLLDSSTIAPDVSKKVAELAAQKGAVYMDAPVSGGVNASKGATLTFMVGGPQQEFDAARELLSCMGKNIVHCGAVGMGQAAKICNNMLLAISMIGTSETMNLGMRLGLDPKLLASILNSSSGRCWSSDTYNPVPGVMPGVPSSNQYKGGFATALVAKDLGLALNAAVSTTSPAPLGGLALQVYRLMAGSGYAEKDFSSVFEFLQEQP